MPHCQLELASGVLFFYQVLSVQLILSTYFLVSSKCVCVCACVCVCECVYVRVCVCVCVETTYTTVYTWHIIYICIQVTNYNPAIRTWGMGTTRQRRHETFIIIFETLQSSRQTKFHPFFSASGWSTESPPHPPPPTPSMGFYSCLHMHATVSGSQSCVETLFSLAAE